MNPTERFLHALAVTESNDNPDAPFGDCGRAVGRYQAHPDWVVTFMSAYEMKPIIGDSWDTFVAKLISKFYEIHTEKYNLNPEEVAMTYHIGHIVHPSSTDWDVEYANKFRDAYNG